MRVFAALLALLFAVGAGAAADLKVTAAFDVLEVRPDDLLLYEITVSGSDIPRMRQDPNPDFSDFQVISGPSRGSYRASARRPRTPRRCCPLATFSATDGGA